LKTIYVSSYSYFAYVSTVIVLVALVSTAIYVSSYSTALVLLYVSSYSLYRERRGSGDRDRERERERERKREREREREREVWGAFYLYSSLRPNSSTAALPECSITAVYVSWFGAFSTFIVA
jgi:hypothetical protein